MQLQQITHRNKRKIACQQQQITQSDAKISQYKKRLIQLNLPAFSALSPVLYKENGTVKRRQITIVRKAESSNSASLVVT